MSTSTTSLALTKPAGTETYDVSVFNDNADAIDQKLANKGSDIASANSITLPTDGWVFDITGTTTVNSLSSRNAGLALILRFDGALQLTHNSTSLDLPAEANITTVAGDIATFVSEGSGNWRCVNYTRNAGTPLALASSSVATATLAADAVTGAKIADDAIDSEHYADGSIDAAHLAANSVTAAKFAAGGIPYCLVRNDAATSVANATETVLSWNTDVQDPDTSHDPSSNPSRITPGVAGQYVCFCSGSWASNATGVRTLYFKRNGSGSDRAWGHIINPTDGDTTIFSNFSGETLTSNGSSDYFEVVVAQSSGGSLDFATDSNALSPFFGVLWVGPEAA